MTGESCLWPAQSTLLPRVYRLVQYQMHWPSEHTLEGRSYPGELHLVYIHTRYPDLKEAKLHSEGVAVVAVLIAEDKETANPELEKIGRRLFKIKQKGSQVCSLNLKCADCIVE